MSPPGAVDFLFVDVDDVLHQQVSLKAVDAVAVQNHFLSAGRTAETAAVHQHGGPSVEQRWLHTGSKKPKCQLNPERHRDAQTGLQTAKVEPPITQHLLLECQRHTTQPEHTKSKRQK